MPKQSSRIIVFAAAACGGGLVAMLAFWKFGILIVLLAAPFCGSFSAAIVVVLLAVRERKAKIRSVRPAADVLNAALDRAAQAQRDPGGRSPEASFQRAP